MVLPAAVTVAAVGLVGVALGCSRPDAGSEPEQARAEERTQRSLATATAFDLVPAPTGALLAWAPRAEAAGANRVEIRLGGFDASGVAVAARRGPVQAGPEVRDLALAATESGVVLAWREAAESNLATWAAWIGEDGSARRFELGPSAGAPPASRGGLALAARSDGALLFARGAAAACDSSSPAPCAAFQFFRISPSGARATGIPLAVPSPCDDQAAQLVLGPSGAESESLGRFDYAVCSRAAAGPTLTVFSIQPNPAYAMAEDVFAGCTPLGAGRFAGEASFVAACGASRRMATAPGGGESLRVRQLDRRGLICRNGTATLALGDGWLGLNEPLGRLELLLDDDLAPRGARAVWAGGALLVARVDDAARLHVASYACRGNALIEQGEVFDVGT